MKHGEDGTGGPKFPERVLMFILVGLGTVLLSISMFTLQRIDDGINRINSRIDTMQSVETQKWEDLAVMHEQMEETRITVNQLRVDLEGQNQPRRP